MHVFVNAEVVATKIHQSQHIFFNFCTLLFLEAIFLPMELLSNSLCATSVALIL